MTEDKAENKRAYALVEDKSYHFLILPLTMIQYLIFARRLILTNGGNPWWYTLAVTTIFLTPALCGACYLKLKLNTIEKVTLDKSRLTNVTYRKNEPCFIVNKMLWFIFLILIAPFLSGGGQFFIYTTCAFLIESRSVISGEYLYRCFALTGSDEYVKLAVLEDPTMTFVLTEGDECEESNGQIDVIRISNGAYDRCVSVRLIKGLFRH